LRFQWKCPRSPAKNVGFLLPGILDIGNDGHQMVFFNHLLVKNHIQYNFIKESNFMWLKQSSTITQITINRWYKTIKHEVVIIVLPNLLGL